MRHAWISVWRQRHRRVGGLVAAVLVLLTAQRAVRFSDVRPLRPGPNRVDTARGIAYLSPIFRGYREGFGANDRELLAYPGGFFPAGAKRELLERGRPRIEYTRYDWNLNSKENGNSDR